MKAQMIKEQEISEPYSTCHTAGRRLSRNGYASEQASPGKPWN
jgi:hypothetical protein